MLLTRQTHAPKPIDLTVQLAPNRPQSQRRPPSGRPRVFEPSDSSGWSDAGEPESTWIDQASVSGMLDEGGDSDYAPPVWHCCNILPAPEQMLDMDNCVSVLIDFRVCDLLTEQIQILF